MSKIIRFAVLCLYVLAGNLFFAEAQTLNLTDVWSEIAQSQIELANHQRQIVPDHYRTLRLHQEALLKRLDAAPARYNEDPKKAVVLEFPMPDGSFHAFQIEQASVMHPVLAKKYPAIRSFAGYSETDPSAYARFGFTPQGFHAIVFSAHHSAVFIDPVAKGITDTYISYYKKDYRPANRLPFECQIEQAMEKQVLSDLLTQRQAGDCQLRTYRLALACTGEYAQFHGGTKPQVLAAMVTAMVRVNGVFETDFGITMEMIANNDTLIFLNANSDPYTNNSGGAMLSQNQTTVDNIIGNANYDIGHVFSTGGGGIAGQIGNICLVGRKAEGVTGQPSPINDPFTIDYVAHEMGHQFGGNHTQNNSCGRALVAAMEPGSASTIMGYAGICAPNVQFNSDAYFHAINIQEITQYTEQGLGSSCPHTDTTGNHLPTIDVGASNYTLPVSTPFVLTAEATDPDGDVLTYCWEQMNNQVAPMPPVSTSTGGPMFRSISPTIAPHRYFPNLNDLVSNVDPEWEELPSVSRTMNFRCTVRDNHPANGCTDEGDVVLTFDANAGPFLVLNPNTNLSWIIGDIVMVEWDVANTNAAPVNCSEVNILLSTDGGMTYPHLLVSNVPNTGSYMLMVPNLPGTDNRIRIQCADNVFFDISDTNFTIEEPPAPIFTLVPTPGLIELCGTEDVVINLNLVALGGFAGQVSLSAEGVPPGAMAAFDNDLVIPTANVQLTLSNLSDAPTGEYPITIRGLADTLNITTEVNLSLYNGIPQASVLLSPQNGERGVDLDAILRWNQSENGQTYQLEVANKPTFGSATIVYSNTAEDTMRVADDLNPATVYYWRVISASPCGVGSASEIFSFQTAAEGCKTFSSTDVPVVIAAPNANQVTSSLEVGESFAIKTVSTSMDISHSWIGDLIARLRSPMGSDVLLFDRPGQSGGGFGCNEDNILVTFNDEAPNTANDFENSCEGGGLAIQGEFQPIEPLASLTDENAQGSWVLTVSDEVDNDGGSINDWSITICFEEQISSQPSLISNRPLVVPAGMSSVLSQVYLEVKNSMVSNDAIYYTLLQLPQNGTLMLNSNTLAVGDQFTQADINANTISYTHDGSATFNDQFVFDVTDVAGGWLPGNVFIINILGAGELGMTASLGDALLCFGDQNGSITITAFGGTMPYQYSLNGGAFQSGSTFNNLPAGSYDVSIMDDNGLTDMIENIIISEPAELVATNNVVFNTIAVNASGGTGGYQYSLNGIDFQNENIFQSLPNDTYTITVRDANGCEAMTSATVMVAELSGNVQEVQGLLCFGDMNGQINATGSGGIPPYQYSLNGGAFQSSGLFTNLGAGNYTIAIRDSIDQEHILMFDLAEPDEIQLSLNAMGNDVTASATGGTGSYEYSIDGTNFQDSPEFPELPNDTYTITVRDENGCTDSEDIVINVVGLEDVSKAFAVQVLPNPNKGTFSIRYQMTNQTSELNVQIFDALGRQLFAQTLFATTTKTTHSIKLNVAEGIYHLHISSGQSVEVIPIVIVR